MKEPKKIKGYSIRHMCGCKKCVREELVEIDTTVKGSKKRTYERGKGCNNQDRDIVKRTDGSVAK